MPRSTPKAASSKLWVRCVAVIGVVLITLAWTGFLDAIADLPTGYGAAQSRDQTWLKAHAADWSQFRVGTSHDVLRYVPGYLIFGLLLIGAVVFVRRRVAAGLIAPRDRLPTLVAISTLVIGAAADVVETLLFRRSLTRLIETSGAADVSTLTSITSAMTVIKWAGLGVSYLTLIVLMLLPPGD
ncbi:MAG TPA: hypothetical protein VLD86_14805 [Ilumatobacteraceae bacterium]|nr:hypothetical protein [Ilumatobacteraceae bacterium]